MATRNKDALTPFKLDHLQGIFYIYLLSVIVSSFVLVTEIACHRCKTKPEVVKLGRKQTPIKAPIPVVIIESTASLCLENDC